MSNTSASGGYLQPAVQAQPFAPLSLIQFLQTVFVGISNLPGDLVRPKWQINPPKQPEVLTNWMAFQITEDLADTNAYVSINGSGNNVFQRMEALTIQCSFYGQDSMELAKAVRDGFQIPQNLEALNQAGMGFVNTDRIIHLPELVNERWVDRYEMAVYLRREILRTYPVLTFLSVNGTIKTVVNQNLKTVAWIAEE